MTAVAVSLPRPSSADVADRETTSTLDKDVAYIQSHFVAGVKAAKEAASKNGLKTHGAHRCGTSRLSLRFGYDCHKYNVTDADLQRMVNDPEIASISPHVLASFGSYVEVTLVTVAA